MPVCVPGNDRYVCVCLRVSVRCACVRACECVSVRRACVRVRVCILYIYICRGAGWGVREAGWKHE